MTPSLVPATYDLIGENRICRGAVFAFSLSNLDADGNPMFSEMSAQIRRKPSSSELLGQIYCELSGNNWIFALDGDATASLPATTGETFWAWDAKGITPDGLPVRVLEGRVEVDPEVTR